MRVALVTNHPRSTGVGRYAITLFKTFKNISLNYDIDIHLFEFDRSNRGLYISTNNNNRILIKKIDKNIILDSFIFDKSKLNNLFFDYRLGYHLPNDYDLYHLTNQIISNLSYFDNIKKCVITVHDLDNYTHSPNFLQKILGKLIYKGVKNSDLIISVSQYTKYLITQHLGVPEDQVEVIYHGVDEIFKPYPRSELLDVYIKYGLNNEYKYILHVGVDLPRKNFITLLRAFYKLIKDSNINNIRLIKIGKINETTKKIIESLNLQSYIKVIDFVPEKDLVKIYNVAEVFVFPSTQEGFGFPILEAMACGTPVVTSNVASIPEIVGDAGIMLDPVDINGFAEAIRIILIDESLRKDMRRKGLKRAKTFSWEKCARKTLKIYKEVL